MSLNCDGGLQFGFKDGGQVIVPVFLEFTGGACTIEIINNTRGGIGTGNISRERKHSNGGQIQVPDAMEVRNTELYIRMDGAVFIVYNIRDVNLPPINALPNFALNASSSVIYNLYGLHTQLYYNSNIAHWACM